MKIKRIAGIVSYVQQQRKREHSLIMLSSSRH
jgi:hypothetical protein